MTSNIIFCAAGVILLSITGCMAQLDVCGSATLSTKIVGGANANNGSWPWQASINAASFGGFYCSGSLINNQWVLTQAQVFILVKASQLIVYLGRNSQKGPNPNEISRNVTKIIKHPNYISEENNVALLKLSSPVTFNDHIKPVCLAAAGSVFVEGTMGWVTGWGSIVTNEWNFPILPDLLQEVEAPVLNSADCQNAYGGANTDGLMCAGFFDGGKAPCVGDYGSPLVTKQGDKWIQSGVGYYSYGCGEPEYPPVYIKVSGHEKWISNYTNNSLPGFILYPLVVSNGGSATLLSFPLALTFSTISLVISCFF